MNSQNKFHLGYDKLHLGCGSKNPKDWLNLDGSWNAWLAKYPTIRSLLKTIRVVPHNLIEIPWDRNIFIYDVRKPLPFVNNSFSAIYASHLLEHLHLEEAKNLLKECHRILKPKGILRMVVPNLEDIIREYIDETMESYGSPELKADRVNRRLHYRLPQATSGGIIYKIYTALTDLHLHKWSYDIQSMIHYFKWAGFVEVNEMKLFQSRIDGIEKIEDPKLILDGAGICVEGSKA